MTPQNHRIFVYKHKNFETQYIISHYDELKNQQESHNLTNPKRPFVSATMNLIPLLWQKSPIHFCSSANDAVNTTTFHKKKQLNVCRIKWIVIGEKYSGLLWYSNI